MNKDYKLWDFVSYTNEYFIRNPKTPAKLAIIGVLGARLFKKELEEIDKALERLETFEQLFLRMDGAIGTHCSSGEDFICYVGGEKSRFHDLYTCDAETVKLISKLKGYETEEMINHHINEEDNDDTN